MADEKDKWEHTGSATHMPDVIGKILDTLDGTHLENVHNKETGEDKVVYVGSHQTVGEAIEKGQFKE